MFPFFQFLAVQLYAFYSQDTLINCFELVQIAGTLSKFGAGLFLLVQVIMLLDATHSWNDAWVAKDEQKW